MARKILLADDSVTAQNMGRKILADAGYEVITVNNGSAALKKIAELKPDLVILDVYMPGYSGLEVCQRLKESQDSSRIPVLLTVGKLEPFKPEEAHRVRAEGFIVKPFEASELLSALSKLEDKVVPRAEPSKPGRFARAIAAAEESSRISRNDTSGDDGWKSRIAFPHEKTAGEKVAEEDSTYNPVNRDLRTVVERPAEKAAEQRATAPRPTANPSLDVAALAPPGFPQDVTPEEVAAIAAAAAQIQMATSIRDEQPPSAAESTIASSASSLEKSSTENLATAHQLAGRADDISRETEPALTQEVQAKGVSTEESRDVPVNDAPVNDVPVTMAAATQSIAAADGNTSRWTAVAVALEADEAMVSLEQEMQKAYAAFVAEEAAPANETAEIAFSQNLPAAAEVSAEPQPESISSSESVPTPQPEPIPTSDTSNAETAPQSQDNPEATASLIDANIASAQEPAAFVPQTEPALAEAAEPASIEAQAAPPSQFPEPNSETASDSVSAVAETAAAAPQELPSAPPSEAAIAETAASGNAFAPIPHSDPVEEYKIDQTNEDQPQEDSEALKNTAAAWASWRQIRDTGDAKPETAEPVREELNIPEPPPAESAAMAVAAGAEQNAQDSAAPSPENPQDVASIVDSVLADLRPRLMAEITRKMSEKK
ncbi:MAG: response regulator [Candidatus Sulfotelmatobacter sp.]